MHLGPTPVSVGNKMLPSTKFNHSSTLMVTYPDQCQSVNISGSKPTALHPLPPVKTSPSLVTYYVTNAPRTKGARLSQHDWRKKGHVETGGISASPWSSRMSRPDSLPDYSKRRFPFCGQLSGRFPILGGHLLILIATDALFPTISQARHATGGT